MQNNISREDLDTVIEFLKKEDPVLTQSENVKKFESEWSNWLGVKHSVFVNSGASANFITLAIFKELVGSGEIIVPPLTWISDIASVINAGFTPKFIDLDPRTLSMDCNKILDNLSENTKAVFVTHVQGFCGISDKLLKELERRDIPLIEDVCESHGATFQGKKVGTYGLVSNFSFYYAHHMSTIEGGMISTNDETFYQLARMFRSHGMVRESSNKKMREEFYDKNPELNSKFIFAYPAFNHRNNEIGAIIGLNQLKRLDKDNITRTDNFLFFLKNLDDKIYVTDFAEEGSSNYAFNVVLKRKDFNLRDKIERSLASNGIEFRRGSAGGGNQLRQPYLKNIVPKDYWKKFPNTEHIHHFAWYIGNYPGLSKDKIKEICGVLNSV